MQHATFFLEQQRRQHVSRLNSWASQVQSARTPVAALNAALTLEPIPHPLLRGMKSIYGSDYTRAKRTVELRLIELLEAVEDEATTKDCLRLARRVTWARDVIAWAERTDRKLRSKGCK